VYYPSRHRQRRRGLWLLGLCCLAAVPASGARLAPLEGDGYFRFVCDVFSLAREDSLVDVVVAVAVGHREITFVDDAGLPRARVRATATLTAADGREVSAVVTERLAARNASEAASPTLQQIFNIVLREVPFRQGVLRLVVEDLHRKRPGLAYLGTDEMAFARATADWYAPPAREPFGLAVGDVVFLAHAPIRLWEHAGRGVSGMDDGPWQYSNPLRRYGLEAEALQVYFNLEPPGRAADRVRAAARDLRLEIASDHLDFTLVDTVRLSESVREALAAGRAAAVYWEMDASGLPPGRFRLGIAPLDTVGRGELVGFDVVWRVSQLARDPRDLLGEGRTVLSGEALRTFEAANQVERELQLAAFWKALDPSPEDAYNEVYAEYRRRVAYVELFLGGYDERGARDPRGAIYLLLGEPDSVREEHVPMNERDLEDARVQVYQRYGLERTGSMTRGRDPQASFDNWVGPSPRDPIPLPYSYLADRNIQSRRTAADSRVFQLWRYNHAGTSLFPNTYSRHGGGMTFLFVDKTGLGDFVLDSSNAFMLGD